MNMTAHPIRVQEDALAEAVEAAAAAIPPLWPLSSSVAVNPFLGQTRRSLAEAGARLARVAGAPVTRPRSWYAQAIASGRITDADLAAALAAAPAKRRPQSVEALKLAAARPAPAPEALPTVADLAAEASGIDWPGLIAERIGAWAADHFDGGQALWAATHEDGAYRAWRSVAIRDLTPEIAGLRGFSRHVADAPEHAPDALARATHRLGLPDQALEVYFHRLLMTLGGWAQYARRGHWEAAMDGRPEPGLRDLIAIRLLWEEALFKQHGPEIEGEWARARAAFAAPDAPTPDMTVDAILQEAAERADQRALAATLAAPAPRPDDARAALQAVFCIDVRSERFRRALETVEPSIRTSGFAGFFGLAAEHQPFASDLHEHRLPVLLKPAAASRSGGPESAAADRSTRVARRATRAWGRFKLAAVSSFAFVEAAGPTYVAKLLRDALGRRSPHLADDAAPRLDPAPALPARTDAAEKILRAMSMTRGFARLVLLAGHGAGVTNNPHASALHCGACGGHTGEVNARLVAGLLNDPQVRRELTSRGIAIPDDTLFLGGLHDTTSDEVTLYDDHPSAAHQADLRQARDWLSAAARLARAERALGLPRGGDGSQIARRGRNWAEVRPEWGLAGCRAFIAAPRSRVAGRKLEGRAFLHDYDWTQDEGFGVLELIMTAPVVVASWISLQYYGSTVAPETFGAGNKLLHNVTGGIGVVEGNRGLLRPGLPWQSVHDGERLVHEPLRLAVCIEAPVEAMNDVLSRHEEVRALFDNRWLHLFALDESGRIALRYAGNLEWVEEASVASMELTG